MAVWAVMKIANKNYWQWTATTAVSVFILMIVLAIIIIFALPRFKKIQGLTDNLNRITREHLTGIRVVRAYNAEQYQENKFAKANDEVTETNMTANRVMALMSPTMTLISSGLTLVVYWFEYLWDNEIHIDDNTLSVNIMRIREKLRTLGAADFIQTKRGMGYKI